jgi:hypothetical protein
MTEFDGVVTILNKPAPSGQVMIALDGKLGDATFGGNGQIGEVIVKNGESKEIARLGHIPPAISLKPGIIPGGGKTPAPVPPANGALVLRDADGEERLRISAADAGANIELKGPDGSERVKLNAATGDASIGGGGVDGDVVLESAAGNPVVLLDGGDGNAVQVRDETPQKKIVFAFEKNAFNKTRAGLFIGAHSTQAGKKPGFVAIRDDAGNDGIILSGATPGDNIAVDEPGRRVLAFDKNAFDKTKAGLFIGAHITQGGKKPGLIALRDSKGNDSLVLDGAKGDIILTNADCAENFDVLDDVDAGTVVVLANDGSVRASTEPYDRRVAGVIAGAGDYRPGIVLDGAAGGERRRPVSLVGKVFCKVDASHGPIDVGSLLTTSPTPGHAMRAGDPAKAFGAVLGKALAPLRAGQGLIPVLVGLQ